MDVKGRPNHSKRQSVRADKWTMSVCRGLDDSFVRSDPEITDEHSIDQFPIKCSSKSNFDSCVNITEDELGAGSVEIVLENGVVTSIRTVPFPYRLLS